MIKPIIFFLFFLLNSMSYASTVDFRQHEDSLRNMALRIIEPEHDFERLTHNLEFKTYLEQVLKMDGSMHHPFETITTVSFLNAPDNSFRIISWYVPLSDSRFEYFGFFMAMTGNETMVYSLSDAAARTDNPVYETLDHENWYGAYYTELIHRKNRRKDYYILLGWRADNSLTRQRIIEPVKTMGKGRPSFGEPVFRYENNRHKRVIFEYSAKVSMSMRYEPHMVPGERRPQQIIIFDRMSPTHSFLAGHYQYYVPETNIFDGFHFDDGNWIFVPDIDARVPRRSAASRPAPRRN